MFCCFLGDVLIPLAILVLNCRVPGKQKTRHFGSTRCLEFVKGKVSDHMLGFTHDLTCLFICLFIFAVLQPSGDVSVVLCFANSSYTCSSCSWLVSCLHGLIVPLKQIPSRNPFPFA